MEVNSNKLTPPFFSIKGAKKRLDFLSEIFLKNVNKYIPFYLGKTSIISIKRLLLCAVKKGHKN
jgi:hypothetical protein